MKRTLITALAAALTATIATSASAAMFTIVNPSFEVDAASDNSTNDTITGWTKGSGSASVKTFDPPETAFTGAGGDDSPLPAPADQGQAAVWFSSTTASQSLTQDVGTIDGNGPFGLILEVAIGKRATNDFPTNDYDIDLMADGIALTPDNTNLPTPDDGEFITAWKSYTLQNLDGQTLTIRLRADIQGGTGEQVLMDNVTLVPEPASLALLGVGLAMIAPRRRR